MPAVDYRADPNIRSESKREGDLTMATKKPLPENERCRGRHSKCGGTEPALSAKWHLGAECTKAYRAMKKEEAARKPMAAAKATPSKHTSRVTPLAARKPPAPKREPVARAPIAAMVAPEVTVTKA